MWGAKPSLMNPDFARFLMKNIVHAAIDKSLEESYGKYADQEILARHLYPYISGKVLVHDSYNCIWMRINKTIAFPTRRVENEPFNYVGSPIHSDPKGTFPMLEICPLPCRPPDHPDWIYC